MKFRMRKRKRTLTAKTSAVQRPPQVITVNTAVDFYDQDRIERRWAVQKVFASQLFKISRKHLGDNHNHNNNHKNNSHDRAIIRRRTSLADASTAGDTSVQRPDDPLLLEQVAAVAAAPKPKPKPKPSFRITCGTNYSPASPKRDLERGRSTACLGPERRMGLRCTDPPVEENEPKPTNPNNDGDAQNCSFWCPLLSLVPDSYDLRDNDGILDGRPFGFFLLTNPFRKKPDTKRNGIPKVITVVIESPGTKGNSTCCGAMEAIEEKDDLGKLKRTYKVRDPMRSFDSSIFRLEEYLKRANLDADVEDKFEKPMHEPRGLDMERGGTAAETSVTSSISTHSSLKFGASIVNLPDAMADLLKEGAGTKKRRCTPSSTLPPMSFQH